MNPTARVEEACPCDGDWRNHGEDVSCVAHAVNELREEGVVTGEEGGAIVAAAARSDCGKPHPPRRPVGRGNARKVTRPDDSSTCTPSSTSTWKCTLRLRGGDGDGPSAIAPSRQSDGIPWVELLGRVLAEAALACPRCGGRTRVIAAVTSPTGIRQILEHLGLSARAPPLAPARPADEQE